MATTSPPSPASANGADDEYDVRKRRGGAMAAVKAGLLLVVGRPNGAADRWSQEAEEIGIEVPAKPDTSLMRQDKVIG
jgi:hypothetical protein